MVTFIKLLILLVTYVDDHYTSCIVHGVRILVIKNA